MRSETKTCASVLLGLAAAGLALVTEGGNAHFVAEHPWKCFYYTNSLETVAGTDAIRLKDWHVRRNELAYDVTITPDGKATEVRHQP